MQKFVKRIQSRLSHSGIQTSMATCREAYQSIIPESAWESPTDEQVVLVVEYVKSQAKNDIQPEVSNLTIAEPETSGDFEPIPEPETFDIPIEDMPCLQPPEERQASALTTPAPGAIAPPIPQSEITGIVNQVFANQPPALKDQLTDYAMQHAFGDVRQVQEFLEQLRSMEFELMIQTLQDHMNRRGSMLTLLDNMIVTQKHQDRERKDNFFIQTQTRLESFRREMEARLAKQSL
jgi:hypothetical protein